MKPAERAWASNLRSSSLSSPKESRWGSSRRPSWEPIALIDITPEPIPRKWIGPDDPESAVIQDGFPTGTGSSSKQYLNVIVS